MVVNNTVTELCLVGNVNKVVSMSSPEEEYLWEDLSTRIFLTVLQLKLHFLLAATVLYLGYLLCCDGAMSWP